MKCSANVRKKTQNLSPRRASGKGSKMRRQSCSGLEAGEDLLLCRADAKWNKTAADIHFGKEALCPALQKFLLSFARLLEQAEMDIKIDVILAAVGVARLPDKKGLSEIEEQSLRVIEKKWADLVREVRGGAEFSLDFSREAQEFVRSVGGYLVGRVLKRTAAEKQQLMMQGFYRALKVGNDYLAEEINIPIPPRTDEEIRGYFAEGKNLIYEPSEKEVPVARLMAALPHRMLADNPEQIVWEPVREGRWLLVDAQEHCPRAGDRSFRGYNMTLEKGQRIITLPQYAVLWYVGSYGGEIIDLETDTMLATRYGQDSVLHSFGRCALRDLRFSVGEWRHTTTKHPKMGVRLVEVVA